MRRVGFLIFSALLLFALYGVNRFVAKRALFAFAASRRSGVWWQRALLSVLVSAFASRGLWFGWPNQAFKSLSLATSSLELGMVLSALLLSSERLMASVCGGIAWLSTRTRANVASATFETPGGAKLDAPRRQFLTQASVGGAICLGQSFAAYGVFRGRIDYQLEEASVRIPGLPRGLDGFCIAQLSDIHIGQFTGEWELAAAREFLRRARPDLIVLTGDLLDQQISLAPVLGRFVRSLEGIARHGVIAVSGNHDFYAGVDEVAATLRRASVPMLRNQGLFIGDRSSAFALLGVDDVWGDRLGLGPNLNRALESLESEGAQAYGLDQNSARARALKLEAARVLLCHNPSFFKESSGKVALQLSGHTHGGQLLPVDKLLPDHWIAGAYAQNGSTLYVNRGFGAVGTPARLLVPPEITRHILMA